MTNREILLAVRAIVTDAHPDGARPGCLEDGACRVMFGKAWSTRFAEALKIASVSSDEYRALKASPVYKMLLKEANKTVHNRSFYCNLFIWNDEHNKDQRLALIDAVIDQL